MKRNRLFMTMILAVLLSVAFILGGCGEQAETPEGNQVPVDSNAPAKNPAAVSGELTFGGSTSFGIVIDDAIEAFQLVNPDVAMVYEGMGSGPGLEALQAGAVTIAGCSRELTQEELDAGCVPTAVLQNGIAVIVNDSVAVEDLTMRQIADIFTGRVTDWSQVADGASGKIVVVNRDSDSGIREVFYELAIVNVLGMDPAPEFAPHAIETGSNSKMVETVGATPNAIGFCAYSNLRELVGGKAVAVEGVTISHNKVERGEYPIRHFLYFVTMGDPVPGSAEKAFIDFCLTSETQNLIEDAGGIKLPHK